MSVPQGKGIKKTLYYLPNESSIGDGGYSKFILGLKYFLCNITLLVDASHNRQTTTVRYEPDHRINALLEESR